MQLPIYNIQGKETGKSVSLTESVFGITPNQHVIYLDVKLILANKRQGTHKTKGRSEVAGSTRKLHKQKGTGGSRKGDIKSPLFPGGGRIFGPKVRDYGFKLNKKLRQLARRSALSLKAKNNSIMVVEDLSFETPKTKAFINLISNLNKTDQKVMFILPDVNKNVVLSGRNIPKVTIRTASDLNTYELMNAGTLIIAESSFSKIDEILNPTA